MTQRIHKESILEKIRSEEKNFQLLLQWGQLKEQPLGWRSVWLLRQILEKEDTRIVNSIPAILNGFPSFNESQKREWLKALENQKINEEEEGILFDLCVSEWRKIHNHPALRASASIIIFKIVEKYPELKEELNHLMTSEYMESLSPGIRKGVVKSWAILNKG